jgi:hypothetical protein
MPRLKCIIAHDFVPKNQPLRKWNSRWQRVGLSGGGGLSYGFAVNKAWGKGGHAAKFFASQKAGRFSIQVDPFPGTAILQYFPHAGQ